MDKFYNQKLFELETSINELDVEDDYFIQFGVDAPVLQKERYIHSLINGDDNNLIKYSKQQVFEFTVAYMAKLFNVTK
ncbi:hypothetical protein [Sphingobacterium sp.]|uniref:hypothetical protein n=1 Tax=Sphingobacterium sp. TaxID=341027 RepID=UPI0031E30DDE